MEIVRVRLAVFMLKGRNHRGIGGFQERRWGYCRLLPENRTQCVVHGDVGTHHELRIVANGPESFDSDYITGQVKYQNANAALYKYEIANGADPINDLKIRVPQCRNDADEVFISCVRALH